MKAESNIIPKLYEINELPNGTTEINFAENTEETEDGSYIFDFYSIIVPSRVSLAEDVEVNFQKWLAFVKNR